MSLAAPLWLWLAGAVAAGVAVLHFLARRTPRPAAFPTARFVPPHPARWPAFARRPADLLLLGLRAGAVLLLGAAFARPAFEVVRPVRQIVVVDTSRHVAAPAAALAVARSRLQDGDTLLIMATGSLSAGLVRAVRAARALRPTADSFALVLVAPFVAGNADEATLAVRALWTGRLTLLPVAPAVASVPAVDADLAVEDPLAATLGLAGITRRPGATVRIRRGGADAGDSAWAREGGLLVLWPRAASPDGAAIDAVAAGDVVVTGVMVTGRLTGPEVVARWKNGTPAAVDRRLGAGCVREVAVGLPEAGDLPLRPAMQRLARHLVGPCGGPVELTPLAPATLAALAGDGPLLAASALPEPMPARVPAVPWLLAAALVLLGVEMVVRHGKAA